MVSGWMSTLMRKTVRYSMLNRIRIIMQKILQHFPKGLGSTMIRLTRPISAQAVITMTFAM